MSEPSPNVQVRLVVRGRVQGVNFRWTLKREAEARGVQGWVRNCADGSVEAVLQGDGDGVRSVVEWARRGPRGAWVTSADAAREECVAPLSGFEIRV